MRTGILAWAAAVAVVAWPEDGRVGSYGTWTLSRPGFTLALPIRVGEMSDPEREAERVQAREAAAEAAIAPRVKAFEAWFARVRAVRRDGWLDALDLGRASPAEGDYRNRLPGFALASGAATDVVAAPGEDDLELWLHMKPTAAPVAAARALAGVALGACALREARLARPTRALAQRLAWALDAVGALDQPWIVGGLLLEACGREAELDAVANDAKAAVGQRVLARLLRLALNGARPSDEDWALLAQMDVEAAKAWVWVLMLGPAPEQGARLAALERRLPLDAETRESFLTPWLADTVR